MQEEFTLRLKKILEDCNITNVRLNENDTKIYITTSLLNYKILIDICIICVAGYGLYTIQDKKFYLIPIVFSCLVLAIAICIDFNPINKIEVDLVYKTIKLQNRYFINRLVNRYIINKKETYLFDEIKSFTVRSNESFKSALLRYYIDIRLKNDSKRVLISFQKESQAINIANYFTSFLK